MTYQGALLCGREDDKKIYFEYAAYLDVIRYSKVGSIDGARGVLLGKETDGIINIEKVVPAIYSGDEGLESPSFTKQSWDRISNEIRERFSDLKILGQYSTHPEVSATENDLMMQLTFFDETQNILFIFDPINNTESINIINKKNVRKLEGFYLYDSAIGNVDLKLKDILTRSVDREYEYRLRALDKFTNRLKKQRAVYSLVAVILAIFIIYLIYQNIELSNKYKQLETDIESVSTEIITNIDKKIDEAINTPTPSHTKSPRVR